MQTRDRLQRPLEVLREPAESPHPREGPFDHLAPRQRHGAALHMGQLHDVAHDSVVTRAVPRLLADVALVYMRDPAQSAHRHDRTVRGELDVRLTEFVDDLLRLETRARQGPTS